MNTTNSRGFFVNREMDLKKGITVIDGRLIFETVIRTKKITPKLVNIVKSREHRSPH